MKIDLKKICGLLENREIRYLIVGGWNTLFSFVFGSFMYYRFEGVIHIIIIGFFSYCVSITMAFLTHKLLVFRTKGKWLSEYLRSLFVYAGIASIGIVAVWILVDGLGFQFWLAQAFIMLGTFALSYIGHLKFTFKR
jgi:putative flippase GtrA